MSFGPWHYEYVGSETLISENEFGQGWIKLSSNICGVSRKNGECHTVKCENMEDATAKVQKLINHFHVWWQPGNIKSPRKPEECLRTWAVLRDGEICASISAWTYEEALAKHERNRYGVNRGCSMFELQEYPSYKALSDARN